MSRLSAAIVPAGNVEPDITTWSSGTSGYIGRTSDGSVLVDAGSTLFSSSGYLGYESGVTGTATLSGMGSEWRFSTLLTGASGIGIVNVESGAELSGVAALLGRSEGASGTITVTGTQSHFSTDFFLDVGSEGAGSLTILDGGEVVSISTAIGRFTGSVGSVTVSGAGSTWTNNDYLIVGGEGIGTLLIEAGGTLNTKHINSGVGSEPGSSGSVTVTGAGSKWNSLSSIYVGLDGNGELLVQDGGNVSGITLYVGQASEGSGAVVVTGSNSTVSLLGTLGIGQFGSGSLTVENGATVQAAQLLAADEDLYGNGSITITKGGILDVDVVFDTTHSTQQSFSFGSGGTLDMHWNGGLMGVGYKGNGSLSIAEGVTISSSSGHVAEKYGSTGTATISGLGSSWNLSTTLHVGNGGSGSLLIETGGKVTTKDGYLGRGSIATGTATVTGAGSAWTNDISLYVGQLGSGTLTITGGGLVCVGQTLTIDEDLDSDSYINMATGGMLALYGEAGNSLAQFYDLISGTDAIRYWDATQLDWAPLTAATYGIDYTLSYLTEGDLSGYTLLTVGNVGDFDNDGDVDGNDFLAWQRNPNLGSLTDWQASYGSNSPLTANSTAVPEPSSLLLVLLFAQLALLASRKRQF